MGSKSAKRKPIKNKLDLVSVPIKKPKPDEVDNTKKVFYLSDYDDLSIIFLIAHQIFIRRMILKLRYRTSTESYHMNQVVQSLK